VRVMLRRNPRQCAANYWRIRRDSDAADAAVPVQARPTFESVGE
jgi:hypothetical protein